VSNQTNKDDVNALWVCSLKKNTFECGRRRRNIENSVQ